MEILISKAYSDAAGSWFSCELPFSVASEVATPELGSSCPVLDDVNWPLFRCILHQGDWTITHEDTNAYVFYPGAMTNLYNC